MKKTRVKLTTQQHEEARALVQYVLDCGGEAPLKPAQRLLLARYADALTALPEDVARDVVVLEAWLRDGLDPKTERHEALSRLAAAAARVPGLEATAAAEKEARETADAAFKRQVQIHEEHLKTTWGLESERDAARQEAEALRQDNAMLEKLAARERDVRCQRQECVRTRDAMTAGDARVKELTARVAELERERADARESERHATDCFKEAESRATAAEAERDACKRDMDAEMDGKRPGITPPSGPGGGETNPLDGVEVPTGTLVATSPGYVKVVPRTRRPEPTPDVPAMKDEPAAPNVLMEFETDGYAKERMRALVDGSLEYHDGKAWVPSVNVAARMLARALAEAKRELAASIAETASVTAERDTWLERCRKARAERDAATERATAEGAKALKAAEDMRERATATIARHASEHCDCEDTLFCLRNARDEVAALPLESK